MKIKTDKIEGEIHCGRTGIFYTRTRRGKTRQFKGLSYASHDRLYIVLWAMVEKGQIRLIDKLIGVGHFIKS